LQAPQNIASVRILRTIARRFILSPAFAASACSLRLDIYSVESESRESSAYFASAS
jgi:hypothetical protein